MWRLKNETLTGREKHKMKREKQRDKREREIETDRGERRGPGRVKLGGRGRRRSLVVFPVEAAMEERARREIEGDRGERREVREVRT